MMSQFGPYHCHMPWRSREEAVPDPRIAPYRDRAAALLLDGEHVGVLFAKEIQGAIQTGGHLWWRVFLPPVHTLELTVRIGEEDIYGCWVNDDLEADLADWSRGVFTCNGVEYECRWLDEAASADARRLLAVL
jgi:hypothetical protein